MSREAKELTADDSGPGPLALGELLATARSLAPELFPVNTAESDTRQTSQYTTRVTGVAQDHQRVKPGDLFVARRGAKFDAHAFLGAAVAAGAVALIGETPQTADLGAPYLTVPDARRALPFLAAAFERQPSSKLRVLGVTGTDGKTTTSYLLQWLLLGNHQAALLSTAGMAIGTTPLAPLAGHFTTPEASEVQALLGRFLRAGASHVVLESSSHGFSLHRLDAVEYAVGVFTNLTPEHLDHHGNMAEYREAKATLLRRAARGVVNLDDEHASYFLAASHQPVTYGAAAGADVRVGNVVQTPGGLVFDLRVFGEAFTVNLPLVGAFNAWNAAAAVAAAGLEGVPASVAALRLASFPGVPGRMQLIQAEPVTVIVDFAHTAPALTKALSAVRREGARTIVVVGAAGERDPGKRAPLGHAAVTGAELAVFTEEDSRSESTEEILAQMAQGAAGAGGREGADYLLEPDRSAAIRLALRHARPGDVVLLAGKGHERTLERATETLPWDEAAEARAALAE